MKDADAPNILFIVIDALRARNLGCYGYSKPISPNIDKLAREGLLFQNAYSCSNVTDASLTTIFSGMYPVSHGILGHGGKWLGTQVGKVDTGKIDQFDIRFLPEMLRAKGYKTLAVDWLGRWHKRGYDYYSGTVYQGNPVSFPSKRIENYLNLVSRRYAYFKKATSIDDANLITAHAKLLIRKNLNKKFFLFVHYWDTHKPYAAPLSFYKKAVPKDRSNNILALLSRMKTGWSSERILNESIMRYLASIAYIDHQIGMLVEALQNHGVRDKTLIILTSDHGESLKEHEIYFDHHGLYDVSIHVPLIVSHSTFPRNKKIPSFVQHFDLVPTILDFLGIDKKSFDGKTAIPVIHGEAEQLHSAIYAEEALYQRKRAIRTKSYKYIHALSRKGAICRACRYVHGGVEELYNLNTDPEETHNIAKEAPGVAKTLEEKLSASIKRFGSV